MLTSVGCFEGTRTDDGGENFVEGRGRGAHAQTARARATRPATQRVTIDIYRGVSRKVVRRELKPR